MRFGILRHQIHLFFGASGTDHIAQRLFIHGEEANRSAILRRHVANGGAVSQAQLGKARSVEFDKFAHHALFAQHLRDRQHQVGGGGAIGQRAGQFKANHLGQQHVNRLPQHDGFGLNTAHTPAQHAQSVNHRGVAIGPHQRIGIGNGRTVVGRAHDALGQKF